MVYLLLADGFEEVEALTPLDLLRRGGIDVKTVGVSGETVTGSHGIKVKADILPEDANEDAELVIFPGGRPGSLNLDAAEITDVLIERTLKNGGKLAAICAAPLIFGKRGLLMGKKAVCYPGFESYLTGAIIEKESVVTDGAFTTAKGMGAAFEFGLSLLASLTSPEKAAEIAAAAQYAK